MIKKVTESNKIRIFVNPNGFKDSTAFILLKNNKVYSVALNGTKQLCKYISADSCSRLWKEIK